MKKMLGKVWPSNYQFRLVDFMSSEATLLKLNKLYYNKII